METNRNHYQLTAFLLLTLLLAFLPLSHAAAQGQTQVVPTISIASPVSGLATNAKILTVSVHYSASANPTGMAPSTTGNVKSVLLKTDGVVVGQFDNPPQGKEGDHTFSLDVSSHPDSMITLQASAFQGSISAGHEGVSAPVTVVLDKTPPVITATISPAANTAGWNNSNVTVTFTCLDATSGVASCPNPVTVTTDGANQVISGTAMDKAGNSASASVTLNIDKTPPMLSLTSPTQGLTTNNATLAVAGTVTDADPITQVSVNGTLATLSNGTFSLNVNLTAGSNLLTVTATDIAGNTTSVTRTVVQAELLPAGVSGPLIVSAPPTAALAGKPLQYQVIAASANPTSLVFSLSAAPTGMAIDSTTGLLMWTPGSDQVGDQSVTIAAQDSVGKTSQSFTLSVFGSRTVASGLISVATGGVITVSDPTSRINGLSIRIPAGSLSSDTTIVVSELISPPTLGGTHRFLMKGFMVDPDGTSLAIPATVTIPYSTSEFDTSEGIPLEDFLGVYFLETPTGNLEFFTSFSADTINHVVTGTVPHFSVYLGTNNARFCPPPTAQSDCPSSAPATASNNLPAILVHGWELLPTCLWGCIGMGDERTWGGVGGLRYLLGQLDSVNCSSGPPTPCGRIDAWRFDWDSLRVPFERAAFELDRAFAYVEFPPAGPQPSLVNVVAHSFGGILVRTYLEGQANDGLSLLQFPYRDDVNRVMTIGTPHHGIGGSFSTSVTAGCLSSFPTCSEANTGAGGGGFLNNLNNNLFLPTLPSTTPPKYDNIIGIQLLFNPSGGGGVTLADDDGLITTEGADLCGLDSTQCLNGIIKQEFHASSASGPAGLCHTGALFSIGQCTQNLPGGESNVAEVAVTDMTHPLWEKICEFLGGNTTTCQPTLNVTLSDPAGGSVTSTPSGIDCGQTCSASYPLNGTTPQSVTLMASTSSSSYTFTGWSGDCDSNGNVTMNANKACTALFQPSSFTYTYTGPPFTAFYGSGSCPPQCNISGSFTLSQPLPPNQVSQVIPNTFSFTDGLSIITQANATNSAYPTPSGGVGYWLMKTDANGNITGWVIRLDAPTGCTTNCTVEFGTEAGNLSTPFTNGAPEDYSEGTGGVNNVSEVSGPGTWTTSQP